VRQDFGKRSFEKELRYLNKIRNNQLENVYYIL